MEKPLRHGEKIVDGIPIRYVCQPCPECKAKLQAAEELGQILAESSVTDKDGSECWDSRCLALGLRDHSPYCKRVKAVLTAWEQAGKGESDGT